jgi:hypothetical protein
MPLLISPHACATLVTWRCSFSAQVDEAQTAEVLESKLGVDPGALLYIQSRVPLRQLPSLCSKFRCFNRDAVWLDRNPAVRPVVPRNLAADQLRACDALLEW